MVWLPVRRPGTDARRASAASLLAGVALLLSSGVAVAQEPTFSTPVSVSLVATDVYFAVISSQDGALQVVTSGATASFGYPAAAACARGTCFSSNGTATTEIGFRGTGQQVQAALASLTFTPNAGVSVSDAEITVTTTLNPAPSRDLYFNPANGHYYEYVGPANVTWFAARDAAAALRLTLGGTAFEGYLATITDQTEMNFVATLVNALNVWIGASDDYRVLNEIIEDIREKNPDVARAITAGAVSSNVATLTSDGHGLAVGDVIEVTGANATFNGTHKVTAITATTVSFALTTADVTEAALSGNISRPTIPDFTHQFLASPTTGQFPAEGRWYWVTGPEAGVNIGNGCTALGSYYPYVPRTYSAWSGNEPNNFNTSGCNTTGLEATVAAIPAEFTKGEHYAVLNFGTRNTTVNWNDYPSTIIGGQGFLAEFGPFPADIRAALSTEVTWSVVDLLPVAYVSRLAIDCTPDPVVAGQLVTCVVTGGDPGIDIVWTASINGVFATSVVAIGTDGRGTFTFRAPAGSAGATILVNLVDWSPSDTVGVVATLAPNRLPAGGGPAGPAPALLVGGLVLGTAIVLGRIRRGAPVA